MPIPSPADFRNKTKKHSEVREMLAQMAEDVESKEDSTEKANAVKTYADQNKLDLSKINTTYVGGNRIGPKSPKYFNFGVASGLTLSSATYYDSCVTGVTEGETLYLFNDKKIYSPGGGGTYAFYAENPYTNKTQTRIADNRVYVTDAATSLMHQKVTVPVGAKYLILNTRYTNAAGTVNTAFQWAVHSGAFNSSYLPGGEAVIAINDITLDGAGAFEKSVAEAKTYADTNKLDLSKITYEYADGNKIGAKTPKYVNVGINSSLSISSASYYDSCVIRVVEGDLLFLLNDKQQYNPAYGGTFAFFAEDPSVNRTQARIADNRAQATDTATSLTHMKVTVPSGAKYLMLNTRYTNAAGTVNTIFTWAIHADVFSSSYTAGEEVISEVLSTPVGKTDDFKKAKAYTDAQLVDVEKLKTSTKNLFTGEVITKRRIDANGAGPTSSDNDVISSFIPVEYGNYYTVSGVDRSLTHPVFTRISGYSSSDLGSANHVKQITNAVWSGNVCTFLVDDPAIKFVLFPLSNDTYGTLEKALDLAVQVESGQVATEYEPYRYSEGAIKLYKASLAVAAAELSNSVKNIQPRFVNEFVELNKVRNAVSSVTPVAKDLMPTGMGYVVEGQSGIENASNNLYAQTQSVEKGKKGVYVHLMKFLAGTPTLGTLKSTAFTIPSGQFDNDGTLTNYNSRYTQAEYCHPSIAYDAVGVAGFKYWMISSILPTTNQGDATWEDEDLFVSNDAENWQRVRSLYESDKSYTTATLRLPPHSLATSNARKYAFLPCPAIGDVIEISVPADNGGAALERVNITLIATPWKHDPAILIDGGYVYTYHSFHLPYADRTRGQNRFIVCVRTNDGINWEVVRTDGSTMLLTEENSKTIFTKDAQGRYNYMYYAYNRSYMNPEVIKWGENDYELYYGYNFQFRVKGARPYSFDFGTTYPIGPNGSGNHPGLLKSGNMLYLINNDAVYKSADRGATFAKLPHYPMWLGGVSGIPYKKALCLGESEKIILVEAQRFYMQQFSMPAENQFSATNDANFMSLYEFASVAAFEGFAQNGLVDAYIDVQLCKVNLTSQKREYFVMPALSLKNTTSLVNRPLQRVKIVDMNFEQGDTLHMYVTLNSRNGAKIVFGGIDIS